MQNDYQMKDIKHLQEMTAGLFNGKLPVNHPLVQMMINDRIARMELEEAQANWRNQPKRKAYFAEKLSNLTTKVIHHIKMRKQGKGWGELLLTVQKDLLVLTNARPDWTTSLMNVTTLRILLQEYK